MATSEHDGTEWRDSDGRGRKKGNTSEWRKKGRQAADEELLSSLGSRIDDSSQLGTELESPIRVAKARVVDPALVKVRKPGGMEGLFT